MRRARACATSASTAPSPTPVLKRSLRLPEMMIRTGLTKTAIYTAIKRGELPAAKKIGGASIWPEDAVQAALDALPSGCT